jgi:hypothetical protein
MWEQDASGLIHNAENHSMLYVNDMVVDTTDITTICAGIFYFLIFWQVPLCQQQTIHPAIFYKYLKALGWVDRLRNMNQTKG